MPIQTDVIDSLIDQWYKYDGIGLLFSLVYVQKPVKGDVQKGNVSQKKEKKRKENSKRKTNLKIIRFH